MPTYRAPVENVQFLLNHVLGFQAHAQLPGFADATKIEDATVFRVDTVAQEVGGHIEIDLVAATKPLRYATLGHLRRHIERVWSHVNLGQTYLAALCEDRFHERPYRFLKLGDK